MVFVQPLAVEKWKYWGVLLTPLRNLQMRGAFIATFTSEKRWDDDQKKFILQVAIDTEFFHRAFVNPCTTM